jgi:exodeoxyribonuclease VII small subunit
MSESPVPAADPTDGPDFEQALGRLEEIVGLLEEGNLPLEQSLTLYEEGVELRKRCEALLERAETRVTLLSETPEGELEERPFDAAES